MIPDFQEWSTKDLLTAFHQVFNEEFPGGNNIASALTVALGLRLEELWLEVDGDLEDFEGPLQ